MVPVPAIRQTVHLLTSTTSYFAENPLAFAPAARASQTLAAWSKSYTTKMGAPPTTITT